jgi:hypothetical protein
MPEALPWLSGNPMIYQASRAGVIWSVAFWLMALVILYLFLYQPFTLTRQKSELTNFAKKI